MKFSIIIPNLNGSKYLSDCLPALQKAVNKIDYELIIVDNGSTDNSLEIIKKIFPNSIIIKNSKNNGFAPAINQGIVASKYEWIVLLNNDLVVDKKWFDLITQNISKEYAVYSGTVLTKDGTKYESTGLEFEYNGKCKNIKNGQTYNSKLLTDNCFPVWGCSAALAIYNKEILNKIGGFDSDFFAYEEDVDVSLRLQLLGYKTLYVPKAISYHLGGGTSSRMSSFRNMMDAKNWCYIIMKDYPALIILKNFMPILIERLRNLSGLVKSTNPIYKLPFVLIKTYGEILLYLPKMIYKRNQFQKLLKTCQ